MAKKTKRDETAKDDSNRRQFLGRIGSATAATIAAGTIVGATGSTANAQECMDTEPMLTGACATSVSRMATEGRKVQVIGRVSNGKIMFDQASLDRFALAYPNADMAFVAVNAPFDPVQSTGNL